MALSLPDPTYDAESTRRLYPSLPIFEGFPYLVTRVVPAMYHVMLMPAEASDLELVLLARECDHGRGGLRHRLRSTCRQVVV
jgi:hypothetical protein